jgi:C-terminal processing protease CtpA/Prc
MHPTAGSNLVGCFGTGGNAWGTVTVASGQVAQVELVVTAPPISADDKNPRTAGLTFENQLSEVLVETVTPGGPAARAGVAVGDVLVSVDGETIGPYRAEMAIMLIERRDKAEVKLVLERADKQFTAILRF